MPRFNDIVLEPLLGQPPEVVEALLEIRNTEVVRKYMYSDHLISRDEHARWLERLAQTPADRAMVVMGAKGVVGYAAIQQINPTHKTAEWAFYVDPGYKAPGVGSVIEYRVLNLAFDSFGLEKLNCAVLDTNQSVIELHRKFGFVLEGVRRSNIQKDGRRLDVHLLGLTREEWNLARPRFAKLFGE